MGAFIAIMAAVVTISIAVLALRGTSSRRRGSTRTHEADGMYAPDVAGDSDSSDSDCSDAGADSGACDGGGDGGGGDGGGGGD